VCLGVPKAVNYANRKCSGCDLAYCEVCIGCGEVRQWHEGRHCYAADILADRLIEQLPLISKCPQCGEPFYNFDGCFAIQCSHGHAFCGFCVQDCNSDAHGHVLRCSRNPNLSYFATVGVFYRCRAEDLAAEMKQVPLNHPAVSPRLVGALCSSVKRLMSADWLKGPAEAVDAGTRSLTCEASNHTIPWSPVIPPQKEDQPKVDADPAEKVVEASVADAAQRVAAELAGALTFKMIQMSDQALELGELRAAVAQLRDMCVVDLSGFVEDAVDATRSVEEVAALLYAFYDVDAKTESALRFIGTDCLLYLELSDFLQILPRGMQFLKASGPVVLKQVVRLTAHQHTLYSDDDAIVWEAPTPCSAATENKQSGGGKGEVTFVIERSTYARVSLPPEPNVVRYGLPAGARLRVSKTELGVVHLERESDFQGKHKQLFWLL
jgi:hypothetical protein